MGFRDGLGDRLQKSRAALEHAAGAVSETAKTGVAKGQELTSAAGSGISGGAAKLAPEGEWTRAVVETYPQPVLPLEQDWEISISALVSKAPKVPTVAVKLLRLLNRFGAVRLGAEHIGFDGEQIAWSRVTEVRTHRLSELLTDSLVESEIKRLAALLPPVPGRKWVVKRVGELVLALATLGSSLAGRSGEKDGTDDDPRIAAEIVHRGRIRQGLQHQAGLTSALLLSVMPEANRAIVALAEERDIPVVPSEAKTALTTAKERAESMRNRVTSIRSRFAQTEQEPEEPAEAT